MNQDHKVDLEWQKVSRELCGNINEAVKTQEVAIRAANLFLVQLLKDASAAFLVSPFLERSSDVYSLRRLEKDFHIPHAKFALPVAAAQRNNRSDDVRTEVILDDVTLGEPGLLVKMIWSNPIPDILSD